MAKAKPVLPTGFVAQTLLGVKKPTINDLAMTLITESIIGGCYVVLSVITNPSCDIEIMNRWSKPINFLVSLLTQTNLSLAILSILNTTIGDV